MHAGKIEVPLDTALLEQQLRVIGRHATQCADELAALSAPATPRPAPSAKLDSEGGSL